MTDRKKNIIRFLVKVLFIALFFTLVAVFSDKYEKKTSEQLQYELISDLPMASVKAVLSNVSKLPSFKNSLAYFVDKEGFMFLNYTFKITADNKKTNQIISFLQKWKFSIDPLPFCRFYPYFFSTDKEDIPLLS